MKTKSLAFPLFLVGLISACSVSEATYTLFKAELTDPSFCELQGEGYYRPASWKTLKGKEKEYSVATRGETMSLFAPYGERSYCLPSVGEVPIALIPVGFASSTTPDITRISAAFMGESSDTVYHSVRSYYWYCSGGRLLLNFEIADSFFPCPYTVEELTERAGSGAKSTLKTIYNEAMEWFEENYNSAYIRLKDFYQDSPIPVYFLYDAPYAGMEGVSAPTSSMLWAFSINSPAPISWSSIYMSGDDLLPDAHTFIHETGHLLGLEDYYDTVDGSLRRSPLGRMDMMDCSVGDQNAFSKMLLNWSRPYVVTGECEITIRQSTYNNECILLCPDWNGTPYDEYILIELYTPGLLNGKDASDQRALGTRLPSKPGVKVYRVDAQLGIFDNTRQIGRFDENSVVGEGEGLKYFCDNTLTPPYLIQLLDKSSGSAALADYYVASDSVKTFAENGIERVTSESLFYEGDGIKGEEFNDLDFEFGDPGYEFEVTYLSGTEATIKFTQKK